MATCASPRHCRQTASTLPVLSSRRPRRPIPDTYSTRCGTRFPGDSVRCITRHGAHVRRARSKTIRTARSRSSGELWLLKTGSRERPREKPVQATGCSTRHTKRRCAEFLTDDMAASNACVNNSSGSLRRSSASNPDALHRCRIVNRRHAGVNVTACECPESVDDVSVIAMRFFRFARSPWVMLSVWLCVAWP
jgi:hypothetical protein